MRAQVCLLVLVIVGQAVSGDAILMLGKDALAQDIVTSQNEIMAVGLAPDCEDDTVPLDISTPMTFLQSVQFREPATTIGIGLPVVAGLTATQTRVHAGRRNAYSAGIAPGTEALELPLAQISGGVAYTSFFMHGKSDSELSGES